jgi:hypothetical protein
MACRHKWVSLSQSIRDGKIVGELCICEKCKMQRQEGDSFLTPTSKTVPVLADTK